MKLPHGFTDDATSALPLHVLERTQFIMQSLCVLDLVEAIAPMNISLVCRDPELMTREAKALADELIYAYKSPHAKAE